MQSIRSSSTRLLLQRNRFSISNTLLLPFTSSSSPSYVSSRSFDSSHSTRAFGSPATYLISSLTKPLSSSSSALPIVDKEAVEEVRTRREIQEIRPGYIVQLKVEVPENKRRVSIVKGIVIARRNAGLNSTFRIRRLVAGVGVESMFPLYSPNLREIKVLDKKRVRRAKLYYLRDKMNALKKH